MATPGFFTQNGNCDDEMKSPEPSPKVADSNSDLDILGFLQRHVTRGSALSCLGKNTETGLLYCSSVYHHLGPREDDALLCLILPVNFRICLK